MLVATGALSLVAAVAVFAAVAWDDLAGTAQAALLLGLTVVTALVAGAARRRGLVATAEAVGLVSVALGVADVQVARVALEGVVAASTVWSAGLALVAAGAVVAGRALGLRAVPAAGVGLAFLPALVLGGAGSVMAVAGVLAATAAVAVVLDRLAPLDAAERTVLRLGGTLAWAAAGGLAALQALLTAIDEGDGLGSVAEPVLVLFALAAVAVGGVVGGRWARSSQALVLGASVAPVLAAVLAVGVAAPAGAEGVVAWMMGASVLLAVAGMAAEAADRSRPWEAVVGVAGAAALALAAVPALAVVAVVGELLDVGVLAIEAGRTVGLDTAVDVGRGGTPWVGGAVVVQLLALVVLGAAGARRAARPEGGVALAVASLVGLAVVVPVAAGLPLGVAVGGLLLASVAAVAVRVTQRDAPAATALGLGVGAVALLLALPSEGLVLVATAILTALAAVVAVLAGERGAPTTPLWAWGATSALVSGLWLVVVRLGGSEVAVMASVLIGAVVVAIVGAVLEGIDRSAPIGAAWRRVASDTVAAVDGAAALAFGAALLLVRSVDQASVVLAVAGAVAGLSSLRPSRPTAWRASLVAAVVVTWLQLAQADVDLVEAYTLPLALAVLALAAWGRQQEGSWDRLGAGLALAVGPTALLAVTTDDVLRTVITVAVGSALALWGAGARLQAPLAVGSVAVGAVAVRHLAPVAADLPRYLVLAAAGIVLLCVGATFEQRRTDLRRARDAFVRLG